MNYFEETVTAYPLGGESVTSRCELKTGKTPYFLDLTVNLSRFATKNSNYVIAGGSFENKKYMTFLCLNHKIYLSKHMQEILFNFRPAFIPVS